MINSLSPDQIKSMNEYVEKWTNIGLSTDPFTENEATIIINDIYTNILNKPIPKIVIKESPLAAWNYIQSFCDQKLSFVSPYITGSIDANIYAFYDYCIKELKVKIDSNILKKYNYIRKTHKIGLTFPFDDICIVCEKPIHINRKGKIVHCDNGPAILYRDGFSVYILNGVRMKKEYVETPWNLLDPKIVIKETNAEVRRELVRKIGIERLIDKLGAEVVDTKDDYELLLLNINDGIKRPYLKMKNPSIGVYHIEGVHPNCKTVDDALNFRNGCSEKPTILT